ncbi:undecaprenyl-diphosphate phosphatase [Aristophania vespae]|uniref:Undecaprenyl-diphosphatase n=1 Tax=Aristophania vespae TaxID=2697033 RepID=A0A6P1NAH9_9PROT|nr:undecaprenyl-diphosphate phosphatase [Aristophania vespae]QHI95665.1 undecaprenyl-diphosphate phosphatase [Aristophania vespae]UMM63348.1 Undecaprenyl-diphosphatase [Aristophania vespae]
MTYLQALILAVIQGITEPFPVSSLGHAVLVPGLLHWSFDKNSDFFLPFLTMLHVGTLIALAGVFWKDWMGILRGLLGYSGKTGRQKAIKICAALIIATLPAVAIGGLFEHKLRILFATPIMVALFLTLNGILLIATEQLRNRTKERGDQELNKITFKDAFIIGVWQCLALLPGFSRSGATMNGGLLRGLTHLNSARFSLLLAQPIILAATAKELWEMRHVSLTSTIIYQSLLGAVAAGVTALICSKLLLHFFHKKDHQALTPFGIYCLCVGIGSALFLSF